MCDFFSNIYIYIYIYIYEGFQSPKVISKTSKNHQFFIFIISAFNNKHIILIKDFYHIYIL
jgi:hypothetical protein